MEEPIYCLCNHGLTGSPSEQTCLVLMQVISQMFSCSPPFPPYPDQLTLYSALMGLAGGQSVEEVKGPQRAGCTGGVAVACNNYKTM